MANSSLLSGTCDFDTDSCGYQNDTVWYSGAGSLVWARSEGVYVRGIEHDHTSGSGSFLYLTTNNIGAMTGIRSGAITPALDYDGFACVSFYYMMAGQTIYGTLHVLVSDPSEADPTEVIVVSDKASVTWSRAYVTVNVTVNSTITFQGEKTGFFDYIAIDDVEITPGNCSDSVMISQSKSAAIQYSWKSTDDETVSAALGDWTKS